MAFYGDVIDQTPGIAVYAQWRKGIHPGETSVRSFLAEDSIYLFREGERILGAMVLTMSQADDYHAVNWGRPLADDEVAVIHMLAVSPRCQGSGTGAEMVREAIRIARVRNKKAVRLDATVSNTPVHRLYERLGFVNRGRQRIFADNAAWMDFFYFEYEL